MRCSSSTPLRGTITCWPGLPPCRQLSLAQRQTMSVGRHARSSFADSFEQHAVEVIAHVLLRHREMRLVEQPLEVLLRHAERLLGVDFLDRRKLGRRQGRQREAALAAPGRHALAFERQRDLGAFRQRAADVEQLAARHRDLTAALHVDVRRRDELDFEIGAVIESLPPFAASSTLARIGIVCLRSTTPITACSGRQDRFALRR